MLPKTKNKPGSRSSLVLSLAVLCMAAVPFPAFAWGLCSGYYGITSRIANCIQTTITTTIVNSMGPILDSLQYTVNIACTLAVMFFGFYALYGRMRALPREGLTLALKIGGIIFVFGNLLWIFNQLIGAVNDFLRIVLGLAMYYGRPVCGYPKTLADGPINWSNDIWLHVDCAIMQLIGFGGDGFGSIGIGLLGFLALCIFSPPIGFALFIMGIGFLGTALLAFIQAMFIFISSYVAIAVLILIAPLIVPLILFRATKAMFEKWLRLLIGILLQPVFLFAYLSMLLMVMDAAIFTGPHSLYRSLVCGKVDTNGFSIGGTIGSSPYAIYQRSESNAVFDFSINQDPKQFALGGMRREMTGTFGTMGKSDPYSSWGNSSVDMPTEAINFTGLGVSSGCFGGSPYDDLPVAYAVKLLVSFFTAFALGYIFYTMLNFIPYLGTEIAGGILSAPNLGGNFSPQGMASGIASKFSSFRRR